MLALEEDCGTGVLVDLLEEWESAGMDEVGLACESEGVSLVRESFAA